MNLFEIDEAIYGCIDTDTGEIIDCEKLDALQMERDQKIDNIACWIKELNAEANAIKEEKLKLAERQKKAEDKAESLSNYLKVYLNGAKFKSPRNAISYRKSQKVEILPFNDIPEEFIKIKKDYDISKLKEALKGGTVINGCVLVDNINIQIK